LKIQAHYFFRASNATEAKWTLLTTNENLGQSRGKTDRWSFSIAVRVSEPEKATAHDEMSSLAGYELDHL
jgi:hypothetical protein